MRSFQVALTGDFLNAKGEVPYGNIGLDLIRACPHMRYRFIQELAPSDDDDSYWSRLYALEVTGNHIRDVHGLIVLRPWVKRSTFESGADSLLVIGRSGAGYDKIDLTACTENDVALF